MKRHSPGRIMLPVVGKRVVVPLMLALGLLAVFSLPVSAATFQQTNLVSDGGPGSVTAMHTDSHLVNAWGLSHGPTTPWWVSDNHTGVSTLYDGSGNPFPPPPNGPLVVTIPPPAGSPPGTTSSPTGNIFNGTSDFVDSQGSKSGVSRFIFDTEDGTISAWSPAVDATHAILEVDNSGSGAVYKGLAMAAYNGSNYLYATDFHNAKIDVVDKNFHAAHLAGSFTDPNLPSGYAPFNVANIGGMLYVTYAKQLLPDKMDDEAGPGHGFIDIYTTGGTLVRRLASGGALNSPWGMAVGPAGTGNASKRLLVGDFGDGRINVFDLKSGAFRGQLQGTNGQPITIDGLWALEFGNGHTAGPTRTLFFTAGPNDENNGLFGSLTLAEDDD